MFQQISGFLSAIASSSTFGLIPLFTVPLLAQGVPFNCVAFYRYLAASLFAGVFLLLQRQSFKVSVVDFLKLAVLGFFSVCCAFFLILSYSYLSTGLATAINFLYPVFVTVILMIFFHEKKSLVTFLAIFCSLLGIVLVSVNPNALGFSYIGLCIALLSALFYGVYLVGIQKLSLNSIPTMLFTFYILLFSSFYLLLFSLATKTLVIMPFNMTFVGNLVALAFVPTVLSNLFLVYAVQHIGSIFTSVLGAFEALTAVTIGVLVFHETLTAQMGLGIFFILIGVVLVILSPWIHQWIGEIVYDIEGFFKVFNKKH